MVFNYDDKNKILYVDFIVSKHDKSLSFHMILIYVAFIYTLSLLVTLINVKQIVKSNQFFSTKTN